jgi:four helix bundle protein
LAELSTQVDIAAAVGLLSAAQADSWERECQELRAMLSRLIAVRRRPVVREI